MVPFSTSVIFGLSSLLFTLVSYVHIISVILRICPEESRHKAFSACSFHLVSLFYLTGLARYLNPSSAFSVVLDKMFSIQYSILTPM